MPAPARAGAALPRGQPALRALATKGFADPVGGQCLSTDLRARWQVDRQWQEAVGIGNLNNGQSWNFHPCPQRTWTAALTFDL